MKRILVGILCMFLGIGTADAVFAQAGADLPKPSTAPEGSNKGGEVRGLNRADEVAGGHGRQGRERAREAQQQRPDKPDRPGHGRIR